MRARKRFAQHFLEAAWVEKVTDVIAPQREDALIEVGAGRGALTRALAAADATITAIELDRDLAAALTPTLPDHVTLVAADVLAVDLAACAAATLGRRAARFGPQAREWPAQVRVAGNLPYNISTPLIARLVSLARDTGLVRDLVVMVQLEVANRLTARPGSRDYGPLSVLAQTWADATIALRLPPGAFRPPPRVHSAVVHLVFRPALVPIEDPGAFEALVRAVFLSRRKMLSNALATYAGRHGWRVEQVLEAAALDGRRRPETLTLDELARLSSVLLHG